MKMHNRVRAIAFAALSCALMAGQAPPGGGPPAAGAGNSPEEVQKALEESWPDRPEWVDMLADILQDRAGPNGGWFRRAVAQKRFDWKATVKRLDKNEDRRIARDEFPGPDGDFDRLDRARDLTLDEADFDFSEHALAPSMGAFLFDMADRDGNGKLTREECDELFKRADRDGAGFLALSDLQEAFRPQSGPAMAQRRSGGPTKETLVRGLFSQEIGSLQPGPALDESAPDFTLKTIDGKGEVTLSKLVGPKPVVLVFGNFTCGPFRSRAGDVEKLHLRYKDRATFVMVYVREAHPTDGWAMESNDAVGVTLPQPRTYEERVSVARACGERLALGFPMLVDAIDDAVGARYSGMPSRLYVIDDQGKVAYKSGRGPYGFKPAEMEQSLILLLQDLASRRPSQRAEAAAFVPLLGDEECWKALPEALTGSGQALPSWAKAMASQLPRTAAALLETDLAQRTKSPVEPKLRAKMRWVIAHSNRCDYSEAYALADLKRVGGDEAAIKALTGDSAAWPEDDREPLEFARLLTTAAPTISDEMFARLVERFGPERVASMVLLAAFGNFQDRLVLGLGLPIEQGGSLPPLEVRFAPGALQKAPLMPKPPKLDLGPAAGRTVVDDDPEWSELSFDDLQSRLEAQRGRRPRLPVPTWDEAKKGLPPEFTARPSRIAANLVSYRYAPELAIPWNITTRTHWAEAPGDRVFEESLFWVQTRSVRCNYCMGHCEMLLEVAGLDKDGVLDRVRRLGGDDWSSFSPAEQRAYAYARKLSKAPWTLTAADYRALKADVDAKGAMSTFFWLCRGLYMTRMTDGFGVPLERENVFGDPPAPKPAEDATSSRGR